MACQSAPVKRGTPLDIAQPHHHSLHCPPTCTPSLLKVQVVHEPVVQLVDIGIHRGDDDGTFSQPLRKTCVPLTDV